MISPPSPLLSPKFIPLRASPSTPPSPLLSPRAPSLYGVLGVSGAATAAEIRAAYRRLALISHPDASSSASSSAAEFMRIHAAYATLSDPDERDAYDRRLRPRHPPAAFARSPSFPGFHRSRRTWETDQCW